MEMKRTELENGNQMLELVGEDGETLETKYFKSFKDLKEFVKQVTGCEKVEETVKEEREVDN